MTNEETPKINPYDVRGKLAEIVDQLAEGEGPLPERLASFPVRSNLHRVGEADFAHDEDAARAYAEMTAVLALAPSEGGALEMTDAKRAVALLIELRGFAETWPAR